jgi:hypothetical protein
MRWTLTITVLAIGVAGFVVGMRLGVTASESGVRELRFVNPNALETTPSTAARSAGGFTGFGGAPALTGDVLRSGSLTAINPEGLSVGEPSASLEVAYEDSTRLFRIARAATPLAPGDRVVVRTEDGRVTGVLRVTEPSSP